MTPDRTKTLKQARIFPERPDEVEIIEGRVGPSRQLYRVGA